MCVCVLGVPFHASEAISRISEKEQEISKSKYKIKKIKNKNENKVNNEKTIQNIQTNT